MSKLQKILEEEYLASRQLPDGRWIAINKMMYTTGLFVDLDEVGYRYRYCYANQVFALIDMQTWDGNGDPPGPWIKQKPPDRLNPALASEDIDFGEDNIV